MMDIKRLRRNARHTLLIADREEWSDKDISRILANDALKAADVIDRLLAIVERIEGIADSEIDCPFCGVIGDRDHRRDCLVNEARAAIAAAKSTA